MSPLAFDNFALSAVQMSQPDKLSLMPVLLTVNQMLGGSLQSLQSELWMSQAAQWWDKSVLPVGLFVLMALSQDKGLCLQAKVGTLFTLSGDCEETRRVWWRRKSKPHMNSWNNVFMSLSRQTRAFWSFQKALKYYFLGMFPF